MLIKNPGPVKAHSVRKLKEDSWVDQIEKQNYSKHIWMGLYEK